MTPRIKELNQQAEEQRLSEELFALMKKSTHSYFLSENSPLISLQHPALMRAKILADLGKLSETKVPPLSGWNYHHYPTAEEAKARHPDYSLERGFPYAVGRFLEKGCNALLDFEELGVVYLTRQALENTPTLTLEKVQIALWLHYALSPELWGPAGKWTRFHLRLSTLFAKYGLLIGESVPGFYELKSSAQHLEKFGFKGDLIGDKYRLVLPWDFPLSAVVELERILAQESSCSS
jgi:hypothetical protein